VPGAYGGHLDQLALDELDPVVLVQDPGLAHPVIVVNGEAPAGNLLHARPHAKVLLWFARLMEKYTRAARPDLYLILRQDPQGVTPALPYLRPAHSRAGAIAGATATATSVASPTFIRSKTTKGRTPVTKASVRVSPATTANQVAPKA